MNQVILSLITIAAVFAASLKAFAVAPAAAPDAGLLSTPDAALAALASTGEKEAIQSSVLPLALTAKDFVTKVYGVFDTNLSESEISKESKQRFNLTPAADSTGLWLETADGYVVSYYGMTPLVSAKAGFDGNIVSDYCYFFQFPYSSGMRAEANMRQCEFCSSLLQEMHDIGMIMAVPVYTDAIFETVGSYGEHNVNVRLVEESSSDHSGRFIVVLDVEPRAFTQADYFIAQN